VSTLTIPLAINPAMPGTTVSVLGFRGGVIGSLTSGFEHNNSSFTISGSVRSIAYSGHGPSIRVKDERTWTFQEIDCGADDPIGEELGEFAEAVRGAGPVEVDGQAAREAIAVAVAAQTSAERGSVVQLDEFRHAAIAAESA
jgi:predicted dehydrogenase